MNKYYAFIFCMIFGLVGNAQALPRPSASLVEVQPPIDIEGELLAIQDYVNIGQVTYLTDKLVISTMMRSLTDSVTRDLKSIGSALNAEREVLKLDQELKQRLISTLQQRFSQGSTFRYIHYRESNENKYATFSIDADEGSDYVEFKLLNDNGNLYIEDMYNYSNDTWISDAFAGGVAITMTALSIGGESGKNLLRFARLANSNPKAAISSFSLLDEEHKRLTFVQSLMITAASNTSVVEYGEALTAVLPYMAEDSFYFPKFNYYYEKQDFDKALLLLNSMQNSLGGDIQLDIIEAEMLIQKNRKKDYFNKLISVISEPMVNAEVYFSVLTLFVQEKQFQEAVLILDVLAIDYGILLSSEDLNAIGLDFQSLVQSPAYISWLEKTKTMN